MENENRNAQNGMQLPNPHLAQMTDDNLYHFGISRTSHDLPALFGDVKFVCVGGSARRMENFAHYIGKELGVVSANERLPNLAGNSDRFVLYKAGPVLSANHGIGVPSMSVALHELLKMLFYARSRDVTFIRIGTCGGIGVPPGSVIVSNAAVNGKMEPAFETVVLAKGIHRPIIVDQELASQISSCSRTEDPFKVILGKTYCTDDFFEGQARTHGAVCDISEEDELQFVKHLNSQGVKNIEMESAGFFALCHKAGVKCSVVCVTFIDRLSTEDVTADADVLSEWTQRPQVLVARFIKKRLVISV
ncbi:uridine phosphorylase 1-like isoform X4 [Haliotis rufescens]|uniref:uridine phosphorylase 1-like isoform X4 n=1 Tax=Haliotis rufescens TaxID=6454 RepID=UPI00201F0D99|nr:uridine phosphorylase 1-like isoform X4 [Haliotis rufescens]